MPSASSDRLGIEAAWLTVNRACNFRCTWCYATDTKYANSAEMDLPLAQSLIALIHSLGIKHVIFIGGEPTLWPHLFEAADMVDEFGMESCLITNALRLSSDEYAARLNASAIKDVVVSVKAGSAEKYRQTTGTTNFERIKRSLRNSSQLDKPVSVSIVLSNAVADELEDLVALSVECGLKKIMISFCTTTFEADQPSAAYMLPPKVAAQKVLEHFERMNQQCGGNLVIEQSLPACVWPTEELKSLRRRHKISTGCHVMMRNGVIFDSAGSVILCNCLHGYPIGSFGREFSDARSFVEFWKGETVQGVLDRLISLPSEKCISCPEYEECGGGCPLHWFVMEPSEVIRSTEVQ